MPTAIRHDVAYERQRETKAFVRTPFSILIDTAEQHPFRFSDLKADAKQDYLPLDVPIEFTCLGRHPDSLGDYSILGGVGRCHVERKSREDCQGTILGFEDGRRERFEKELANLAAIDAALVVVECSLDEIIDTAPDHGKRTKSQNAKTLFRSILALQQDYRVPWLFCGTRRLAEVATFRFLARWFEKRKRME
jgi:hypothetical protein